MAMTSRRRAWLLPLAFLAGYITAWGTVLVDRQMVIASQAQLRHELGEAKQELRLREMMLDFGGNWQDMVIWNKEAIEPKEVPWNSIQKK